MRGDALDDFARTAYPELVRGRLDGKAVGVVFVGSVDQGVAETVRRAVDDAGGRVAIMRALRVPLDTEAIDDALGGRPRDARASQARTTASSSAASSRASS